MMLVLFFKYDVLHSSVSVVVLIKATYKRRMMLRWRPDTTKKKKKKSKMRRDHVMEQRRSH